MALGTRHTGHTFEAYVQPLGRATLYRFLSLNFEIVLEELGGRRDTLSLTLCRSVSLYAGTWARSLTIYRRRMTLIPRNC
jgi:hypothetical protein